MKHIDLFSGIGGFSYALDQVFYDHTIEHVFSDNNPFCQAVLKKHWPEATIYSDIRTLTAHAERERYIYGEFKKQPAESELKALGKSLPSFHAPFILTGGFPCQPFSQAGRRQGTSDDRYLWPEMYRVIKEFQPEWVVAENVRGLATWNDGMVLEQVCTDLENEGYEVQPIIIPAVAVNAPHRRDRIWFIAHRAGVDGKRAKQKRDSPGESKTTPGNGVGDAADTRRERRQSGADKSVRPARQEPERANSGQRDWQRNWPQVAAELCSVDDGLPAWMGDVAITASRHRKEQLKAYGNAIVPQVAMEIFQAIRETLLVTK